MDKIKELINKIETSSDNICCFFDKVSKIVATISVAYNDHFMFEFNYYLGGTIFKNNIDDIKNAVVINLKKSFKKKLKNRNIYFSEEYIKGKLMYLYSDFVGNQFESWSFESLLKMVKDSYINLTLDRFMRSDE